MTGPVLTDDNNASSPSFEIHSSFSEIASQYDGFILDQFGVLHNGSNALDGAVEAVKELAQQGKKLIILSNSSSLSEATFAKLPKFGFQPGDFCGAVTSGEEASHYIASTYANKKALWITWACPKTPSPMDFLNMCGGVKVVDSVEEADFVLLHGAEVVRGPGEDGVAKETSLGDFPNTGDMSVVEPVLRSCLERKLPMVCANPDFIMVRPDGSIGSMPGKIAKLYEDLGGSCTSFGKPHVPHFEACLRALDLPKERVAHVGDSLYHDIAGANATGISSVLVVGGIHRQELGSPQLGQLPTEAALEELFAKLGQKPNHVVPLLKM
jgi:HAD superfamily hydrolase (TIGR01450 family)